MKRNRNVDLLRTIAILIIVVYHTYVLAGYPWEGHSKINQLMSFGGELGVTLFFLLSGFGIFMSLYSKEEKGVFPSWGAFMKSRCRRIMPPYYICLVFLLLFQAYVLIRPDGLKIILAYFLFGQNLFVSAHGAINGALWALAAIFQFYLIAPFLYRLVRKNLVLAAVLSVAVTICSKLLIYQILLPDSGASLRFVYGRELVSALDNFAFGMIAAALAAGYAKKHESESRRNTLFAVASAVLVVLVCVLLSSRGVYGDSFFGYFGHTILAFSLLLLIYFSAAAPQCSLRIMKVSDWIAANQYGIYLWHMPIIGNLGNGSELFAGLREQYFIVYLIIMVVLTSIVGGLFSVGVNRMMRSGNETR